jgi:hypothetical protein
MARLPFALVVFCALPLAAALAGPNGPIPPKHVSNGDSRFQIATPDGSPIENYTQLGDDPNMGTPISFVHPQQIECVAAGARAFKVEGATQITVDLTRGDLPLLNFTFDGVPRSYLLAAPGMFCALTGDTKAGIGAIMTFIYGGSNAGSAGFTNFDAPQTISCFRAGRLMSQTFAIALSVGAANGHVGLSYTDENGQPITKDDDGNKTACVVETVGMELIPRKEP